MHLIHRPMLVSDIDDALALICDRFLYTKSKDQRALTTLWREIITGESGHTVVIEDQDNPTQERLLYVGIGVFLTDEITALVKSGTTPYVSRFILEQWRQGPPPFLNHAQIALANSTVGLNLLVLHTGFPSRTLHPTEGRALRDRIESYSYYGMGGFNYKEVLFPVYGEFAYTWACGAGMYIKTDYADAFRASGQLPPPAHRPRLMGYDRAELQDMDGTNARQAALTGTPRFYFNAAERKVLLFALPGLTDEEIAALLTVSVATVRKRWQSIYDRVLAIEPERLGGPSSAAGGGYSQKKRRLLEYLRQNLQELRPYERRLMRRKQ